MAKFVAKILPDISINNVKPIFDEIAEDCSLLEVNVDGANTLILTLDTDLVVTFTTQSTTTVSTASSIIFNGNTLAGARSLSLGTNCPLRILYSESFFFCSFAVNTGFWWVFEKYEGNKFANGLISYSVGDHLPLKTLDNKELTRYPQLPYTKTGTNNLDFVEETVLTTPSPRYDVVYDTNVIECSYLGNIIGKIITMNNKDYYAVTNYVLIPIDSE